MWEIFSFGERPYVREYDIGQPNEVRNIVKRDKKIMNTPLKYLKNERDNRQIDEVYEEIIK